MWPPATDLQGQKPVCLQFYYPTPITEASGEASKNTAAEATSRTTFGLAVLEMPLLAVHAHALAAKVLWNHWWILVFCDIKSRAWLCIRQYHFHPSLALCGAAASFFCVALVKQKEKLLTCFS